MLVLSDTTIDRPIVAKGGTTVDDGRLQHLAQRSEKPGRLLFGDTTPGGVDTGKPERLVGIDVADTGDRALAQELGLDPAVAGLERGPEIDRSEVLVEGLWSESVKCRQTRVVTGINHCNPTETSDIAKDEAAAVIEQPGGALVGIDGVIGRIEAQLACHSEVNYQLTIIVELDDQVLPASTDSFNFGTPCLGSSPKLDRTMGATIYDHATLELARELASKRLHLG